MDYFDQSQRDKATTVKNMFEHVAPKYDCFNRVLSLGLDSLWRRKAIRQLFENLPTNGMLVDLGCGSGDLSGEIMRRRKIIGMDFCLGMLRESRRKFSTLTLTQADATRLPFADGSLSGVISAFVIRNVGGLDQCLSEIHRCLLPQGRLVILEFALPKNPLVRLGFNAYLRIMFPIACLMFGGDREAYRYLRKSIFSFGESVDVVKYLQSNNFRDITAKPLMLGGVNLYQAVKV